MAMITHKKNGLKKSIHSETRHIALITDTMGGGGLERAFANLARQISERGHRVDLLLARAKGPMMGELPDSVRVIELDTGIIRALPYLFRLPPATRRLLPIIVGSRPRAAGCLPKVVRYLREEKPHTLLATLTAINLVVLWAARLAGGGTRVVLREANTLSHKAGNSRKLFNRRLPSLAKQWYPQADEIIAVSDGVADDLVSLTGLPRERINTIYNPIDVKRIRMLAAEALDDPWFLPDQPPVLLAAGRLKRQKDYPTLLRAFALVREHGEVRLVILGEGPKRKSLESLCAKLGVTEHVRLPGFVQNPYAYMARASVFVLSSIWEGLANVLREALICGCPVVSTDCPSGSAEILGQGARGRLVPVGDHLRLAEAILATLNNPPEAQLLRKWTEGFSADAAVDRYMELLLR